ncbi:MAG: monomethylamine:corrinoid methyltransferase [Chloroflexota bacterium]|nr:monomethylamine:corrinoid methyltransferase [Chloroflexota bacterium]
MISLLEIAERTQKGPKVAEQAWDMAFFRKVSELLKRHEIPTYSKAMPFLNEDDSLPERAFRAAVDLLVEQGVYCITTGRVIQLTRDEVLSAVKDSPAEVLVGQGKDARVMRQRKVEGKEPLNVCPGHHSPFTEDLASLVVKNFAEIPRTDFLEGFNFTEVDGREIQGPPLEVYATRRQIAWLREGIAKAGRPGLSIVLYPINTRAAAFLSVLDPCQGLRKGDGLLTSVLPDLKVEHDLLATAIVTEEYGLWRISGSFSMAGGFCGGHDGAIVEGVAKALAAVICYKVYVNYTGVESVRTVSALTIPLQPLNWARSVVNQALNRCTHVICMAWIIPTSGPGTETNLLEVSLRAIEGTINGANLYAPRHSRAMMNAGQTPVEAELMIEVSDATLAAGLDRGRGSEVLSRLAEVLAQRKPEPGMTIQQCYDLVHHRPKPELEKAYQKVKEELSALGLEFK